MKIASDLKTEADLGDFSKLLKMIEVVTALGGEFTYHLDYGKNDPDGNGSGNGRNANPRIRLKGDHGDIDLETPRDRKCTFEPKIVERSQSRLTQMDGLILSLYAKSMSTRPLRVVTVHDIRLAF